MEGSDDESDIFKDVDFLLCYFLPDDDANGVLSQSLLNIPTQQLFKVENETDHARFASPVSGADLKIKQAAGIPKKTRQANNWAVRLWTDWARFRNTRPETHMEGGVISENICCLSNEALNFWMQRFIIEIRRKDGTAYPPNTLTQIVAALQRYLRSNCYDRQFNFFKDDDLVFRDFRKTLDSHMKSLTSQGIGVNKKRCDPVTEKDEMRMWETGVFSLETASRLSNAIFFYNGKCFAFRGMSDHKQCDADQFEIGFDHENSRKYVKYTPRVTKNVQGGLKHRRIESVVLSMPK
ncbi:uncharacterized protein LOC134260486 [Saccostrea cucullata]|uniref:uncharacterized protein LOC134260486 n=1 Tax=Saccostrea cuccullata TaxID=36930 RepID=UPI002ED42F22